MSQAAENAVLEVQDKLTTPSQAASVPLVEKHGTLNHEYIEHVIHAAPTFESAVGHVIQHIDMTQQQQQQQQGGRQAGVCIHSI